MAKLTEQQFLKDVRKHGTTIMRDNGLYRHLRCQQPGTYVMGFDILTWPGYLAYTGDMGAYVFTRVEDMFEFFRNDTTISSGEGTLHINPEYWSEKCVAAETSRGMDSDGIMAYSPERYRQAVRQWLEDREASHEVRRSAIRDLDMHASDGEVRAVEAALEYDRIFDGFSEIRLREYTHRFTWCCYALVWAISQFDKAQRPLTKERI